MPSSSITYISATTRGRVSSLAWSVARARPAVWAVCRPTPTTRKAKAAAAGATQAGTSTAPPPDNSSTANGMMARPKNCSIVPVQM